MKTIVSIGILCSFGLAYAAQSPSTEHDIKASQAVQVWTTKTSTAVPYKHGMTIKQLKQALRKDGFPPVEQLNVALMSFNRWGMVVSTVLLDDDAIPVPKAVIRDPKYCRLELMLKQK